MTSFQHVKRVELQYDLAIVWVGSDERSTGDATACLRKELIDLYETYEFSKLILNLEYVTYPEHEDISGMLSMLKPLGRDNVKVCCPREIVEEILRATNLHKLWDICETQQEAIDRFE